MGRRRSCQGLSSRGGSACLLAVWLVLRAAVAEDLAGDLAALERLAPLRTAEFTTERIEPFLQAARQLESQLAERLWPADNATRTEWLGAVEQGLATKRRIDALLDRLLELRTELGQLADTPETRAKIRAHLRAMSGLIDLSGRVRYLQRDLIDEASLVVDADLRDFDRLLDLLTRERSTIGAAVLSYTLFDPPPASGAQPYPPSTKARTLGLLRAAADPDRLGELAAFLRAETTTPEQRVVVCEVIRQIGLPQDASPDAGPELPAPATTARELWTQLNSLRDARLTPELRQRKRALLEWLSPRLSRGVPEAEYRHGRMTLRPGDWLLMRNPSPYNRFTDLSPGLFTHVGIVTTLKGANGQQRFVIVDLPERGDRIPATNLDIFLQRTLHYVFLRHEDLAAAQQMAEAARQVAGRPSQFDLTFRIERVGELRGRLVTAEHIHTYCAGLLWLCAQETGRPQREFFPFAERPNTPRLLENLSLLGMSIGEGFLSPTGALYASRLRIVGQREPMYGPDREIREAIYDHFAEQMANGKLTPAPDTAQYLREKVAGIAQFNPLLARALAKANRVSENMDLQSAARAAAVVETLDEIADEAARGFQLSWDAVRSTPEELAAAPEGVRRARESFPELAAAWASGELPSKTVRERLVQHWSRWGQTRLSARFFSPAP